jgi:hypothetical protein
MDTGANLPALVAGSRGNGLDAPLFLDPRVPDALRAPLQTAYLAYMQGRLTLMQSLQDARKSLQDALESFPVDAAAAGARSRELAQAWSNDLQHKAAYAAQLQALLGEALWRELMDAPANALGLRDFHEPAPLLR